MHSYHHVKAITERLVAQALAQLDAAPPASQAMQAHDLTRNPQEYGELFTMTRSGHHTSRRSVPMTEMNIAELKVVADVAAVRSASGSFPDSWPVGSACSQAMLTHY